MTFNVLDTVVLTRDVPEYPAKNVANRKKHGVSFEEAAELFTSGVEYLEVFDDALGR